MAEAMFEAYSDIENQLVDSCIEKIDRKIMENLKIRALNATALLNTVQQWNQGGTYLPLVVATLLAGAFLVLVLQSGSSSFSNKSIASIPYAGSEYGDVEQRKQGFLTEAGRLLQDGYNKFTNGLFQVSTSEGPTVIVSRKFIEELKNYTDDVVSFDKRAEKTMMPEYTGCSNKNELGVHVVKSDFTAHINPLTLIVNDETEHALAAELGVRGNEWVSIPIFEKMSRIVSMTSGRAFCEELCRNDEWIAITIGYTMNVFTGANAMKKYHAWLRPLVYRWVPELATVHSTKKRAVELIQSVLDQRKRAQIEQGAAYVKPTDMLQWLEEKMSTWTARTVDVPHITDLELILGFASIHSNTGSLTNILYDLVARPEYIAPLRQENEEVVFEKHNHQYSRQALDQLWKLDSFMKESMRYTPTNMTMFKRQILKPVTLSDGTFLPVGTFIEIPAAAVARDPDVVPGETSPDVFDGFRYERLRRGVGKEDAAKYLFATIGVDGGMHFGFGRRACPGRFFTTNLMKLILAHIISEYDLKMVEDDESRDIKLVRYENLHVEATNFVDPDRRLLMRMRQ